MQLNTLPLTSNSSLVELQRPKKLSLQEFEQLPVTPKEMSIRNQIYALEEYMYGLEDSMDTEEMEEAGLKPTHRFVNGLYHRELFIPPDKVIMGKRHATEHIVMLIQGKCWCVTERGKEYMVAPMTFISPAGEKRVVITEPGGEGCTWVTVHPTTKTDLKDIEDEVIIAEPGRKAHYDALHATAKIQASERLKEIQNV